MAKVSNLRNKAKEINSNGAIEFMEGKEKLELPLQEVVTIENFGFLKDENQADYVVFTLKEYPDNFFFGGSVVTEKMKNFDNETDRNEIDFEGGLPVIFERKQNKKKKREYTTCEFFPED